MKKGGGGGGVVKKIGGWLGFSWSLCMDRVFCCRGENDGRFDGDRG